MSNCSAFFPLVRLNHKRWFVSVLSVNANHNVVNLGFTYWWSSHGHARDRVLFRLSILILPHVHPFVAMK